MKKFRREMAFIVRTWGAAVLRPYTIAIDGDIEMARFEVRS